VVAVQNPKFTPRQYPPYQVKSPQLPAHMHPGQVLLAVPHSLVPLGFSQGAGRLPERRQPPWEVHKRRNPDSEPTPQKAAVSQDTACQ
jgi:hypothetical protein